MTTKVNGYNKQGSWFERDTSILTVTATAGTPFSMPVSVLDYSADDAPGSSERIMNVIQTRGTVIGYTVESDTIAHFLVGHAGGAFKEIDGTTPVIAELEALITDAISSVDATITVFAGFKGIDPAAETYRAEDGTEFPTP